MNKLRKKAIEEVLRNIPHYLSGFSFLDKSELIEKKLPQFVEEAIVQIWQIEKDTTYKNHKMSHCVEISKSRLRSQLSDSELQREKEQALAQTEIKKLQCAIQQLNQENTELHMYKNAFKGTSTNP